MNGTRWTENNMKKPKLTDRLKELMNTMTLEEKIGQMTLITAHVAITGPKVPGDYMAALRNGRVGAINALFGAELTREVQRVAIERVHPTEDDRRFRNELRSVLEQEREGVVVAGDDHVELALSRQAVHPSSSRPAARAGVA